MEVFSVKGLSKSFSSEPGLFAATTHIVRALRHVSLALNQGNILGLVGESGSGKSTLGKLLCNYYAADSGTITLSGKPISSYSRQQLSHEVQMIFQDPYASLNPKLSIATILGEALPELKGEEHRARIIETLRSVGMDEQTVKLYPHQFSGGQRQRIAIARALLKSPKLLIADEPLSSLDLTIQNQILNLFVELREKRGIAILFISHDIATTTNLCDTIAVLNNGEVVEHGLARDIIAKPQQEYTRRLLSAVPV